MSCVVVISTKGQLKENGTCPVSLSRQVSISSNGDLVLFSAEVVSNQNNIYDHKGRIARMEFGYHGEEFFEFSYFGDYIANIYYKFESLSPEYVSLNYENGKIISGSGPNGMVKVIYDSYNNIIRGEKI